ncbi:hypothetical protein MATL_G00188940 [Megalops atlanticus]|uniref:Pentraxin family member n=1 Tax=Megalops atlanticus TaxID=7932 RepID=A0A9D3PL64_MEGAT|nr:hypothetical protein MATL_G00188940 [Megalops atlanticus]
MMRPLLFCLLLFTVCCADPQDLTDKVFTFPLESNTAHVKLIGVREQNFKTMTVCLRFFSDLSRAQSVFSFATPSCYNGFGLYTPSTGQYGVDTGNNAVFFWGLPGKLSDWNSLCGTWDTGTGLAQLWVNGQPSSRKAPVSWVSPVGTPSITLGQEQDSYGGGFDAQQSFVGHLTDVHMWDHVLSPCEIQLYMSQLSFTPGNVLNWQALEFTTHGRVAVEKKQTVSCYL